MWNRTINVSRNGRFRHALVLASAALFLSVVAPQERAAAAWAPCGGAEGTLWSWAWAGNDGQNVTTERDNWGPRIAHMIDLSGNGNDYFNDDPFNENPPTRPGYQDGFSKSGYSTTLPIIAVNSFSDGTSIYLQFMEQQNEIDAREFYLAFAGYDSRSDGHRVVWGTTSSDRVRLEQVDNRVDITIGGNERRVSTKNAWSNGPVLIEVWRDTANNLRAVVNGEDVTDGSPNVSAVFAMSGIGGGIPSGHSAWDDYAFEYIACKGLPSAQERDETREYLRAKWGLFGEPAPSPVAPNPPEDLTVEP